MSERHVYVTNGGSWSPVQILSIVLGVVFIVLGGVALLRAGTDLNLFTPVVSVAGLAYTPLLAMIELIIGLIFLSFGAFPGTSDAVVFLGVLLFAFGLVLVIEPAAFERTLAAGAPHGWFYVITGGVAAGTALLTPVMVRRYSRTETYRDVPPPSDRPADQRAQSTPSAETQRIEDQ
jgi:hypothetical protein